MPELASWVELEGCFNFRDLGGYATRDGRRLRTGRVYRADGLQELSPRDLDHLCGERALGHVIDLRSSVEVEAHGRGSIETRATLHPVPLFEQTRESAAGEMARNMPGNMGDLYFLMLTAASGPIARVVRLLAEVDAPAVFHCAAGKDRTGLISALLLSLLDVPDETIVADYAVSRRNLDRINARLDASETYQRLMNDLPEGAYDADPDAMRHFLARVRAEHGSFEGFADSAGIDAALRGRLRERLLA
ncbi:MAG: tyrosine-protein phosphatase [Myxococcales bacterium]|nr:tyrosine-protein phosphatase [Myxococcales bacterium]